MGTKLYVRAGGRIIAQIEDGVRTDFLTDALGSVTAAVDSSQNVIETFRFKPYGAPLSPVSPSMNYRFLWTGDTGSRRTGLAYSEQYNRARHYGVGIAAWTTVDVIPESVIWPYSYGMANPVSMTDPDGRWPFRGRITCYSVMNVTRRNRLCRNDPYTVYKYAERAFCNPHPDVLACARYSEGMTAAWPNVKWNPSGLKEKCCSDGHTARSDCRKWPSLTKIYQPELGSPVPCGTKLRVWKGSASITVTVIDAGPNAKPLANAILDLTPTAAKKFATLLPLSWRGCGDFAVSGVSIDVEKEYH